MTEDNQLEYNGLVLGPGTDYVIRTIEGLNPPDSRQSDFSRTVDHGSFIYANYFEDRLITLDGVIHGSGHVDKLEALRAALVPQPIVLPMRFKFPDQDIRRVYVSPTRRHWDYTEGYKKGMVEWVIEFRAGDPRLYDDTEGLQNIAAGATETITNEGVVTTAPSVNLSGPLTNPKLTHEDSGYYIRLTRTIAIGEVVTIDFNEKTIKADDDTSLYADLDINSTWWILKSGDNDITLEADSGIGSAELRWRSAWM